MISNSKTHSRFAFGRYSRPFEKSENHELQKSESSGLILVFIVIRSQEKISTTYAIVLFFLFFFSSGLSCKFQISQKLSIRFFINGLDIFSEFFTAQIHYNP